MTIDSLRLRRLRDRDIAAVVELINRVDFGGPLTAERWAATEAGDGATYVAVDGGRIVAAIPFALRDLAVAPGKALRAASALRGAFAHMVCVEESYRGRGLGSRLMSWSFGELAALCELACVYTAGEGHSPYRFYENAGFYDLLYAYRYDSPASAAAREPALPLHPPGHVGDLEPDMGRVFRSCYPQAAGFPPREGAFWSRAFRSVIFSQGPELLGTLLVGEGSALEGYAILARERALLKILELATLRGDLSPARRLLRDAVGVASREGLACATVYSSVKGPFVELLRDLGWQRGARQVEPNPVDPKDLDPWEKHRILAGRVLDLEGVGHRVWSAAGGPEDLSLRAWTDSTGPLLIHAGRPGERTVSLEMKEEALHRLVLRRLNLLHSIEAETITVQSGTDRDLEDVARSFSPSPWNYFELDYI